MNLTNVSGSYDFQTSAIFNSRPAGTKKIKVINDIKRREQYSGSIDHTVSGSWNDYHASSSVDPTGSYLSTYISTIGLYDKSGEMIAVAKLPQPIKNLLSVLFWILNAVFSFFLTNYHVGHKYGYELYCSFRYIIYIYIRSLI